MSICRYFGLGKASLLAHVFLTVNLLQAQAVFANTSLVEDSIRSTIAIYVDGWRKKSGEAFASAFAEKAHFVNIFGMHFSGRKQTAMRHQKVFDTFLKGTTLSIESIVVTPIKQDLVMAHVIWNLKDFSSSHCQQNPQINSLLCPRRGIFNHVFIPKSEGTGWEIVESQNTLIHNRL